MPSPIRPSLLVATFAVGLAGCFEVTGSSSSGIAFCDDQSSCVPGCVSTDVDRDGCADRCEAASCASLPTVSCGDAMPIDADGDGCARECLGTSTTCGGIAGLGCEVGEFCDYALDEACGAGDRTGLCVPRPDLCTELYQPVCGCDGRTYGNECAAHGAGVAVAHWGRCESSVCPAIAILCATGSVPVDTDGDGCVDGCQPVSCPAYVPDCGGATPVDSNGDGCALECPGSGMSCGGLTANGPTPCPDGMFCDYEPGATCGFTDAPGTCAVIPDACAAFYDPVCGCDGTTYGNDCEAGLHGVGVLHVGPCDQVCEPVSCGHGTVAFDLDGDGCVESCRVPCGGIAGLACGGGKTCFFTESASCGAGDQFGYCDPRPTACPTVYAPVCGCDGRTYGNGCEAASAGVSVQHHGACAVVCPLYYPNCGPGSEPGDTNGDGCIDGCVPL